MNVATKLILVAGDKGGVGKTTTAKILYDYFRSKSASVFVFDTEYPDGNISRTIKKSKVVDIDKSADQALVLDSVLATRNAVVLVDLRAGHSSKWLEFLERIGFLEQAKKGAVDLVLAHVIGASSASVSEIPEFSKYSQYLRYVPVLCKANNAHYKSLDIDSVRNQNHLVIEKLDELVFESIDNLGVTFLEFVELDEGTGSFVLKGYTKYWYGRITNQIKDIAAFG